MSLIQFAALPESHTIETVVVAVLLGASKAFDHFKGKKRDRSSSATLREIAKDVRTVKEDISDMKVDARDLRAFVVGPDGRNGLRSDVRRAEERLDGLEERERDRLHGPYNGSRQ